MKTLKYSRQRESIKACLMRRKDHPTADALYTSIREQFPNISLGTVYRNLNLLVDLGEIRKFSCGDGTDHFDYDTSPHYHFVCRRCGRITDIPMEAASGLEEKAAVHVEGTIEDHTIFFYGVCADCQQEGKRSAGGGRIKGGAESFDPENLQISS